jgi:type I restriction enzyme S subunit
MAASRRAVVRQGQFILSRIDARNGAFGLVPENLDGAVVSNDFPSFDLNQERLEPKFLEWLSKTSAFVDLCKAASEGTTNRVRLKEEKFLTMAIPLPPFVEQQRIVARIEELAAKIEEAQGLRRQALEEAEFLCRSLVFGDKYSILTPMHELVRPRGHTVNVKADETYHFAGVYSFGRGVFRGQKKSGMDFAYKQLGQLKAGNFVYPKLMAWEGALGVVPHECDGLFVSPEFPIFDVIEDRVLPETLDVYFRTPSVWPLIAGESTGTNVRRRRLNPKDFLAYKIPLPSMQTQLRLRQVMQKVNVLKRIQVETKAELDAMLPSMLDKAFRG